MEEQKLNAYQQAKLIQRSVVLPSQFTEILFKTISIICIIMAVIMLFSTFVSLVDVIGGDEDRYFREVHEKVASVRLLTNFIAFIFFIFLLAFCRLGLLITKYINRKMEKEIAE